MDVFVLFYHQVFTWVVETDAAVLGTCHTVLSLVVELYCIDRALMGLRESTEGRRKTVRVWVHSQQNIDDDANAI